MILLRKKIVLNSSGIHLYIMLRFLLHRSLIFFTFLIIGSCSSSRQGNVKVSDVGVNKEIQKGVPVLIYEQTRGKFGPCEPSIAINPKDPRQMVAGSVLDFVHRSDDFGKTWKTSSLTSRLGVYGDPCVEADRKGNFYYFHLGDPEGTGWNSERFLESIVVQKSKDGGKSWSEGKAIGPNPPKQQDKEWACIHPKSGDIYVSWTEFDKYGDESEYCRSRILFSKSEDGAEHWTAPIVISGREGDCKDDDQTPEGAVPGVDLSGNIFVSWAYNNKIYFDRSLDDGETWLKEDRVIAQQSSGWTMDIPGLDRCNGMPVTAVDNSKSPFSGTIYVVYADQKKNGEDTDIWLIKSMDKGEHWTQPINVFPDDNDKHQFLPWITVDPRTGKVFIVFYDRSPYDDLQTDVVVAGSDNGGMSFKYVLASDSSFIPPGAQSFFGDYNNIDAVGGLVRPIWTSYREGKLSVWTSLIYWP